MTKAQKKLLNHIAETGMLPTLDEAVEMYTSNSMRQSRMCAYVNGKAHTFEYHWRDLEEKAASWLRTSVGSLVIQGYLSVDVNLKQVAA